MTRYQWRPDLEEHEVIPGTEGESMRLGERLLLAPELNLGPSNVVNPEVKPKVLPKDRRASLGKSKPLSREQQLSQELNKAKKQNEVLMRHGKPDKQFLENLEAVKFEEGIGYVGQMTGKVIKDPKQAVKMNDFVSLTEPKEWNMLRYIDRINYEEGNKGDKKPYWMKKQEEQNIKTKNKIIKSPIGNVRVIDNNKTNKQLKALRDFGQNTLIKNEQRRAKYLNKQWGLDNKEKTPDNWSLIKGTASSPQDIAQVREVIQDEHKKHGMKYIQPDEKKYLHVNGVIPGEPEVKAEVKPEVSHTSQMIDDMEHLAKQRLESQILENKFHEIMKPQRDPDMDKGIASVDGVEDFKKVVALSENKFGPKNPGINNLLGEPK